MDIKSVSATRLYVRDLQKSREFYEKLGFRPNKNEAKLATFNLNWYTVELLVADKPDDYPSSPGDAMCIRVVGIDKAYDFLVEAGYKPNAKPAKHPNGTVEFTVNDPDGHSLVFFDK